MDNLLQVSTITTHHTGVFRRAGFAFTRGTWTTLRVADVDDAARGIVTKDTIEVIKGDKLLVTRVPTPSEVEQLSRDLEASHSNDEDRVSKLEAKLRELQAALALGGVVAKTPEKADSKPEGKGKDK